MWIISQHGFYAIVRDRENASRFLVRARVRKDLQNLKALAGLEASIQETSEREYPFQLLLDEREMPRLMNALGNTVDYPCFSARVAQRVDQACRALIYCEVMQSLRSLFDPAEAKAPRPPARSAGRASLRSISPHPLPPRLKPLTNPINA